MTYISPTYRPCCKQLWEHDHAPGCPELAEENIEADWAEWDREMVMIQPQHVDGNPS